jgi:hypothetical protein
VTDLSAIMGSYDTINNRYHLLIPSSLSNDTYEYVFDYGTESWVENVRTNVKSISALDGGIQQLTISELSGTIDSLVGTIDSLTGTTVNPPRMFYGLSDGNIYMNNPTSLTDNSTAFTTSIRSKVYSHPDSNLLVRRLSFKYVPKRPGTMTFYFSRDAGVTWETYEQVTILLSDVDVRKRKILTKGINAQEFCWRIDMETANVQIVEYYVDAVVSPLAKSV